jgi:catechol 2,3-dioxygenase-like lactoylglutathione lyase family enzyme
VTDAAPPLAGVFETCLYYAPSQAGEMERFYGDALGLREVDRGEWGIAYRLGAGLLLLFDVERSITRERDAFRHGATGPAHACLLADRASYEAWKGHLAARDVDVFDELTWRNGVRSFYFRDPAGNVLEIAEDDLWPR